MQQSEFVAQINKEIAHMALADGNGAPNPALFIVGRTWYDKSGKHTIMGPFFAEGLEVKMDEEGHYVHIFRGEPDQNHLGDKFFINGYFVLPDPMRDWFGLSAATHAFSTPDSTVREPFYNPKDKSKKG